MGRTTKKETVTEEVKEEEKIITPAEYFELVKSRLKKETPENVQLLYNTTMKKLQKFIVTGQVGAAKELYAKCLYLEKEIQVLEKGVNKYVLRSTIDNYIDNIADKCVVLIEMSEYERDIPDEIVDLVVETKDIFDKFWVMFTDYTGEKRSKVEEKRREKDPILFGNIMIDGKVSPKFYFLGDWVDEHCDLTLDKLIEETAKKSKKENDELLLSVPDYTKLDDIETALFGRSSRATARTVASNKKEKK